MAGELAPTLATLEANVSSFLESMQASVDAVIDAAAETEDAAERVETAVGAQTDGMQRAGESASEMAAMTAEGATSAADDVEGAAGRMSGSYDEIASAARGAAGDV